MKSNRKILCGIVLLSVFSAGAFTRPSPKHGSRHLRPVYWICREVRAKHNTVHEVGVKK